MLLGVLLRGRKSMPACIANARTYLYVYTYRDHLLPPILAEIHPNFKTPVNAQLLCGALAIVMAAFFNVKLLSEMLDVGVILGYGTVCACVLVQRSTDRVHTTRWLCGLIVTAAVPFAMMKHSKVVSSSWLFTGLLLLLPLGALVPLVLHQTYSAPPGDVAFSCPLVPYLPLAGVLLNVYLGVNLTVWAWLRLLVVWGLLLGYYVWSEHQYHVQGQERGRGAGRRRRQAGTCFEDDGGGGRLSSPSESLRRRRQQHEESPLRKPLMEDVV